MKKLLTAIGIAGFVVSNASTASAASIGLVDQSNPCLSYNGVFFCDADIQPTGTGVFNPFLRTLPSGNEPNRNPSSGWNTGASQGSWSQPNDANDAWTSELAASSLGTSGSPIDGLGSYFVFTVDINQEGKVGDPASLLSLLHFELYNCGASSDYTSLSSCTSFFNVFGGGITYDANDRPVISTDTWVDFDYRVHNGSGSGDINVFVPVSVFPANAGFIALLDGWGTSGTAGNYADNDGFQEWRAQLGGQTCPDGSPLPGGGTGDCDVIVGAEPASMVLFGLAALGAGYARRRRISK